MLLNWQQSMMLIQCHRFLSSKLEEIDEDSKPREDGIWTDLDPYNRECAKLGKRTLIEWRTENGKFGCCQRSARRSQRS